MFTDVELEATSLAVGKLISVPKCNASGDKAYEDCDRDDKELSMCAAKSLTFAISKKLCCMNESKLRLRSGFSLEISVEISELRYDDISSECPTSC